MLIAARTAAIDAGAARRRATGKGKLSLVLYASAIPLAFVEPLGVARRSTCCVAVMWLIPDRRIERITQSLMRIPIRIEPSV